MKVVSYNVRYFSHRAWGFLPSAGTLAAIGGALSASGADVICLQEVEGRSLRSRFRPQFDALSSALGDYRGRYFPVHRLGPIYSTGLAVLVRQGEIVRADVIPLSSGIERRGCAHVQLRDLHVFNTHLSLPGLARFGYGKKQLLQAQELRQIVAERAGSDPFIVCGDFNARPSSPVHRLLAERWSSPPTQNLDHLFAGNGLRSLHTLAR